MKVSFELNGVKVSADVPASMRLVDLLHDRHDIRSIHPSCYQGECGTCAILLNGELTYSCVLPAFAAEGSSIVTYEGISKTEACEDIIRGLKEENAYPCSYCLPSKVVIIQALLQSTPDPTAQDVFELFSGTCCPCTNFHNLSHGIIQAAYYRRRRRHG